MSIETFRRNSTSPASESADPAPTDDIQPEPGSFSVSTQLMQDAIKAEGVSTGPGKSNQEALFANAFKDGREETLVIDHDSHLTYLERTDSSDTGWVQSPVSAAGTSKFTEVVVAVHPNRSVWAFCVPEATGTPPVLERPRVFVLEKVGEQPDGTAVCAWAEKTGASSTALKPMWSLSVSYTPDAGPVVVGQQFVGIGSVVISAVAPTIRATEWHWHCLQGPAVSGTGRIVGGGYQPAWPRPADGNYVYYVLDRSTLTRFSFAASYTPGQAYGRATISTSVDAFCGTWNSPNIPQRFPQGDVGYLYLEQKTGLIVTGYFPTTDPGVPREQRTQGLGFVVERDDKGNVTSQPSVWQDADNMLHVFGVSSAAAGHAGALRVLHQSGWQATEIGTTENWPVFPQWTSARVAGGPGGIGGFDLLNPSDRLVAFDYTSSGARNQLLAYGPDKVWVLERNANTAGAPFEPVYKTSSWPIYPFTRALDQVVAYDYDSSGHADHLLAYWPGMNEVFAYAKGGGNSFGFSYHSDSGIAGLPITATTRLVPFDYTRSGKDDHLLYYAQENGGTALVLAPPSKPGGDFTRVTPGKLSDLAGFPLDKPDGFVVGFDYDSSGSNTHLLAYRPAAAGGMAYIVTSDTKGGFTGVVKNNTTGIGGYDLKVPEDRLVPFDYTGLGYNDHIFAYRPGSDDHHGDQTVFILERVGTGTQYQPVVNSRRGIAGYDFASRADQVIAYDYFGTGSLNYLVAYRPGAGKVSVFGQRGGQVLPVYQVLPEGAGTLVTVGLHAGIMSFLLDPYPDYKPSQLIKMSGTSVAEAYCLCTQDVTTSQWQMDKVRLPEPDPKAVKDPYIVSHYVADVALLNKQGTPMSGHNVTISADSLVEVQVGAVSYQVGPGRAIATSTDAVGKLQVSIAARGLDPQVLHLNADGLEGGVAIDFAAQANAFLAGNSSLPSQSDVFTPGLLENATYTPDPTDGLPLTLASPPKLVNNWPELKQRGLTPGVVVDHCSNAYSMAAGAQELKMSLDGFDTPQTVHGYVIQLWDPDRPAFQAFADQGELDDYRAYRNTHPAYGGWWDEGVSWASDVWEGIKSGATHVAEVIVSTISEIAVWVGNAVVSLGEMIIEAIEQAIQAVEAVFQMIAEAISKVIDWLKSLFALADIWDTKEALEFGVKNYLFPYISGTFDWFLKAGDTWFDDKRATVEEFFDEILHRYGDARIGDFQNKTGAPADATGRPVDKQDLSNPQATWLLNKTTAAAPHSAGILTDVTEIPAFQTFSDFLDKLFASPDLTKLIDAAKELQDLVTKFFTPGAPDGADSSALATLINTIRKIVQAALDAAKGLFDLFMNMVIAGMKDMDKVLDLPFDLGIVNDLYKWVQRSAGVKDPKEMTLGGLGFLVLGFFVTTIYKLIRGVDSKPFEGGAAAFPQIPPPPWMPKTFHPVAPVSSDPAEVNRALVIWQVCSVPVGVIGGFATLGSDLLSPFEDDFKALNTWVMSCSILEASCTTTSLALGCPSVTSGGPWDPAGGCAFGFAALAMLIDWFGVAFGHKIKATGKRASLLKNLGASTEDAGKFTHRILEGSIVQLVLSASSLISGCFSAKASRDLPFDLHALVWTEAIVGPLPKMIQVARAIVDKFWKDNAEVRLWTWGLASGADGLLTATSGLLPGVAACIAIDDEPSIAAGTYTFTLGQKGTQDVKHSGGTEGVNKPLKEWTILEQPDATKDKVTVADGKVSVTADLPLGSYDLKLQVHDSFAPPLYARGTITVKVTRPSSPS